MSPLPLIESVWSHYVIIGCASVSLVWGGINAMFVSISPIAGGPRLGSRDIETTLLISFVVSG
jgi:hypothetical protein